MTGRGLGADGVAGAVAAVVDEELHAFGELWFWACAGGTLVRAIGRLAGMVVRVLACIWCAGSGGRHGCLLQETATIVGRESRQVEGGDQKVRSSSQEQRCGLLRVVPARREEAVMFA